MPMYGAVAKLAALVGLLAIPQLSHGIQAPAGKQSRSVNLIEKEKRKWNWREASEESKTEWGIVLKRYIMVDMALYELERHFDEALPESGVSVDEADVATALSKSRTKLAKLKSNLDMAVLDQNTTDTTAADMQIIRKGDQLTKAEKKILDDEHNKESMGFFSVLASAQDVYQQASLLQTALETAHNSSSTQQSSWQSIVAPPSAPSYSELLGMPKKNLTATKNATAVAKDGKPENAKQAMTALFQKYKAAAQTFHSDVNNFESMQKKAFTNLLALHAVSYAKKA